MFWRAFWTNKNGSFITEPQKSKKVLTNRQKGSIIKRQREADDGCPFETIKKITALFGRQAVIFLYYLRFIKRAARVISTIAKANNASYVTITTKVRMRVHRHNSFLIEFGRSKTLLP